MDKIVQIFILLAQLFDLLNGMENGGVMFSTEVAANFRKRRMRKIFHQVHRDLSRVGDLAGVAFYLELSWLEVETLGNRAQNRFDGDLAFRTCAQMFERVMGHRKRDGLAGNGRDGD